MSIQRLITQWLAAQTVEAVKRQAVKEIFTEPESTSDDQDKPITCTDNPDAGEKPTELKRAMVDIGFVFAMPMEAAGIADRLKQKKTTRGDGRTFHTGLLGDYRVALVESGVGQEKAGRAAEVLVDVFQPRRILSAGYGGGLSKRLKRFNVCFPDLLVRESDGAKLDLSGSVPKSVTDFSEDRFTLLTTDFVVTSSKQKKTLNLNIGAELVDMETFAVAEVCRRHDIPFLAVRIILDTAEEELPKDVQKIMKDAEVGGARLAGSVLGSLFSRPSSMLDLFTLKQRALEATDRLAKRIAVELRNES